MMCGFICSGGTFTPSFRNPQFQAGLLTAAGSCV
jgi:hypothetical protein